MAKTKTSFTKKKQPAKAKRPPRGKSERTKILEAMERIGKTEDGFYDLLAERAHDKDDSFTFRELLIRLSPIPKAVAPLVKFSFSKKDPPHIQAADVLDAISNGDIPSDTGKMFIESISAMLKIQEITDFEERLKAIEDASKQSQ